MKHLRFTFSLGAFVIGVILTGCGSDGGWERQSFAFARPDDPPGAAAGTNLVALARVEVSPLFRSRTFTYRTGDDAYEQDPYACFLASPEHSVGEAIRAWMRHDGEFGRVLEPGDRLNPSIVVEASVLELSGDFRKSPEGQAAMTIHFLVYEMTPDGPGRILLDEECAHQTPMSKRTPAALMAGWDSDLREIMEQLKSDYAKTHPDDR